MRTILQETNEQVLAQLESSKTTVNAIVEAVIRKTVTRDALVTEFGNTISKKVIKRSVTDDNIRCFFDITLEGLYHMEELLIPIFNRTDIPLYENIYDYLEEIIDDYDFAGQFQNELSILNKDRQLAS